MGCEKWPRRKGDRIGRVAITRCDISNRAGETIKKGSRVVITDWHGGAAIELPLTNICIRGVSEASLTLLPLNSSALADEPKFEERTIYQAGTYRGKVRIEPRTVYFYKGVYLATPSILGRVVKHGSDTKADAIRIAIKQCNQKIDGLNAQAKIIAHSVSEANAALGLLYEAQKKIESEG